MRSSLEADMLSLGTPFHAREAGLYLLFESHGLRVADSVLVPARLK
jgi:hypothetical protein